MYRRTGAGSLRWVALALLAASVVRAEPHADAKSPEKAAARAAAPVAPTPSRRALSAGAAVIPGVLVHGAGHYALGQPRTADRLLFAEGIGTGMALGGAATIFFTGASRYLIGPAAAVTGIGVGLLITSFAADLYGTLSPDPGAVASRITAPPFFESELGYRHLYDPQFSYRNFVVESLSIRTGRFRVTPSGWFSTAGDSARYRVEGAYRLLGALPRKAPSDGLSSLDIIVAGTHHRDDPWGFVISSGEVAAHGRYDLANVGPTLRGAFVEGDLGYAHQIYSYDVAGVRVPTDDAMMLLLRFGFGAVLRGRAGAGSEVLAYYDHRRDGYAAGFLTPGIGSAISGLFGATGRWYFSRSVGVLVDVQLGSAVIGGASLLLRQW